MIPQPNSKKSKLNSGIFHNGTEVRDSALESEMLSKHQIDFQINNRPEAGDMTIKGKKTQKIDVGVHTLQPYQMIRDSNYFD